MKKRKKLQFITAYLLFISIILQVMGKPVRAETNAQAENGVTVYTREEFMDALTQKKSPIIIGSTLITIGNQAEASGRMLPVKIPEGTVIRGRTLECQLNCRAPIQLEGDGVVFEDMSLVFESSDALGSVPHREIFLAGHSLTLDNVSTYLAGGTGDNLGDMGSSEEELLPTVCAGGYPGTSVGTNASFKTINSNDKTMFKGIYMGHTDENGDKEPYSGKAILQLDPKATVREGVHTEHNSEASIDLAGEGAARAIKFYGNDNTVLTIRQTNVQKAVIDKVGSVVLDEGAWLAPDSDTLHNVSVKNESCLDFSNMWECFVTGDFCGEESGSEGAESGIGILVLAQEGCLTISGDVTGKTQFQTGYRNFPGLLIHEKGYITAKQNSPEDVPFVLSQKNQEEGFELKYDDGIWRAYNHTETEVFEIGSIEIPYAKTEVDLSLITEQMNEEMFCKLIWRDKNGQVIGDELIDTEYPYAFGYVFPIKTEYWESDEPAVQEKEDWSNAVTLERSEENPDNYILYAFPGAQSGRYTFLFFSELIEEELLTVADVRAKRDLIKAEMNINFYDSSKGEQPPAHLHSYYETITKKASCMETGIKTWTCSGCGDSYTEEIPKTGHTEVIDPAVEATCTEDGKTQGSHCGVCNTVIRAQSVTSKTGHTEVDDPAIEATCTEDGRTKGSHCSVCNEVLTIQQIIPKKAHDYRTQTVRASVDKDGYSKTECVLCGKTFGEYAIASPKTIALSSYGYTYDGTPKRPSVTVRDKNGRMVHDEYFTVDFVNNKDVGLAEVKVTFQGNYEGSLTETFQILPGPVSMKKLKASGNGFTVKWKKQNSKITGYMIQYSTNRKFSKKTTKLITVGKSNAASKKVKKVKGGKKYFVRMCAYKTVQSGKTTARLCSQWSKAKTVKVKK